MHRGENRVLHLTDNDYAARRKTDSAPPQCELRCGRVARCLLIHHQNSQSQRIFWLLEELEIPYNLELHTRQESGAERSRAPAELRKTHPLGKAPQLITADGRVIIESTAIAKYLLKTYDTTGTFAGDGHKNDWIRNEELSSLAANSLQPILVLDLVFQQLTKRSPFFIRPIFSATHKQLQKLFIGPEVMKLLAYLDDQFGDQEYLMGIAPGEADFILSWPIDSMVNTSDCARLEDYPKLNAWHKRCKARPAWQRSIEKGNGYFSATMAHDFVGGK